MTNLTIALTNGAEIPLVGNRLQRLMARKNFWQMAGTFVLLWLAFALYRNYFWGDISTHFWQTTINSLADAVLGCSCGLLLYHFQMKRIFKRFFLPAALVGIGLFSLVLYWIHYGVYMFFGLMTVDFRGLFDAICFQLLDSVAIVISGSMAMMIQQQQYDRRQIVRAMEIMDLENKRVELKYLKSQMDPHFVFNGLNMIYHQVPEESTQARESLLQFSGILRYHLQYAAGDKVSLSEETNYLKSYVQFQKKRCSDFMEIEADMEVQENEVGIEPLLLLPLVENAVKFCKGTQGRKGSMRVYMRNKGNGISFKVENSYNHESPNNAKGTGIGLENVRRRLSIMYPGRHNLEVVGEPANRMFTCNLEIWS